MSIVPKMALTIKLRAVRERACSQLRGTAASFVAGLITPVPVRTRRGTSKTDVLRGTLAAEHQKLI
jgi:hypothetical protein